MLNPSYVLTGCDYVVLRNIFNVILDKPAGNLSRHIKDDYNNKSLQFYENTRILYSKNVISWLYMASFPEQLFPADEWRKHLNPPNFKELEHLKHQAIL